jgi:hypothetical protein
VLTVNLLQTQNIGIQPLQLGPQNREPLIKWDRRPRRQVEVFGVEAGESNAHLFSGKFPNAD